MAVYWAFRIASLLARAAPLRLAYACGYGGGLLAYALWFGGRRRCVHNMLRVTGGDRAAARRAARRSFANYGIYLVDFLRFSGVSSAEVRRRIVFEQWHQLDEALDGNGVLFVTIHFGNWDMGAAALAEHGYPTAVIADSFAEPRLNELVLRARHHLGMEILPADRVGPGLLRALRRNQVVAALIDVPQGEAGVEVEFFGATIAVPGGLARVALSSGASVVAATVPRLATWSDEVTGDLQRVTFEPSGDRDHDVRALTQAIFGALETMVRRRPEQWYIFRTLWLEDALPERSG
ncbi:MAG: lysophospholipid acyltransferase family protein [Chloroflexi bacterium]|nr:lysophospholipid acyltransferase family protein [Chloroflexota bacterium]